MRAYVVAAFVFALLNAAAPAFAAPAVDQSADAGNTDATPDTSSLPGEVGTTISSIPVVGPAVSGLFSSVVDVIAGVAGSLPVAPPSVPVRRVRRDDIPDDVLDDCDCDDDDEAALPVAPPSVPVPRVRRDDLPDDILGISTEVTTSDSATSTATTTPPSTSTETEAAPTGTESIVAIKRQAAVQPSGSGSGVDAEPSGSGNSVNLSVNANPSIGQPAS